MNKIWSTGNQSDDASHTKVTVIKQLRARLLKEKCACLFYYVIVFYFLAELRRDWFCQHCWRSYSIDDTQRNLLCVDSNTIE